MVLMCDGAKVDAASVDSIFEAHPRLQSEAEALAAKKKKYVKPDGVLYARQKVNWLEETVNNFFISEVNT